MSTRASYLIKPNSGERQAPVHIYKHHDGYPAGAARWFWETLRFMEENKRAGGGFAENFLRVNLGSELTEDVDQHGDREHHYTVEWIDGGWHVEHTHYPFNGEPVKEEPVPLHKFINEQAGKKWDLRAVQVPGEFNPERYKTMTVEGANEQEKAHA